MPVKWSPIRPTAINSVCRHQPHWQLATHRIFDAIVIYRTDVAREFLSFEGRIPRPEASEAMLMIAAAK
jgi:hypothetical protein